MKPYETPDVIEIGRAEDVVLGSKIRGFDNPDDPDLVPPDSCLDVDE